MKKLNFVLEGKVNFIYKSQKQDILYISVSNEPVGFICVNKSTDNDPENYTYTPFTQFGLLANEDCIGCALESLFFIKTSLKLRSIELSETQTDQRIAFISALANAFKNSIITH